MAKKSKAIQPIDKPRFRYWEVLYRSFFDGKVYVDAAKHWKGLGIFYVFFALAIMLIPFSIRLTYEFKHEIKVQFIDPISTIPLLYVHNGRLVFDDPMPYLIKNKRNEVVGIIDTTGTIKTKTRAYPKLVALLQEKEVYLWPPSSDEFIKTIPSLNELSRNLGGEHLNMQEVLPKDTQITNKPEHAPYPKPNEVFDVKKSFQESGLNKIIYIFLFLIYPSLLLFIFIMNFFFLLIFAMMGQLLASIFFSFKLAYSQASRLLAVAFTPAITILWLSFFMGLSFPGIGIVVLTLSILYFCYGVMVFKRASKSVVRL